MALNSYVLVPAGFTEAERARMLGHSVETNRKYYTFDKSTQYMDEKTNRLNQFNAKNNNMAPHGTSKIIDIETKKESQESAKFKAFS